MKKARKGNLIIGKLEGIRVRHVALLFTIIGIVVFASGLMRPFQNDDAPQIVDNQIVHSFGNISKFFAGSTFYDGEKLSGIYYRPLMTTTYSLIYSVSGAQPTAYHLVQLALHVGTAVLVFLVLTRWLKRPTAFILALIFLIHPLNSQVVLSIPTMQDALYAFFGMWALWRLIMHGKEKSYWDVAGLLMLSLFSKEAGILFVIITLLYQWFYRRDELRKFILTLLAPIALYLAARLSAVGFVPAQHAGPINDLTFWQRLLTLPSAFLFYFVQFVWPSQLALTRYWTHESWSLGGVVVPLLIDIILIALMVAGFIAVKRRLKKPQAIGYGFFALWLAIGMAPYLQILPGLDMTACETWFYVPMIGLLGMIGITLQLVPWKRVKRQWQTIGLILLALVIVALGARSVMRGFDYSSQTNLAYVDLTVEADNYAALNNISQSYLDKGDYEKGIEYAKRSIDRFPVSSNYVNLGAGLQLLHQYPQALAAYDKALSYGESSTIYANLALIHIVASKPVVASAFFARVLHQYPHDFKLWLYDAVFEGALGNHDAAKTAITTASQYGEVPSGIYTSIMNSTPFTLPILDKKVLIL